MKTYHYNYEYTLDSIETYHYNYERELVNCIRFMKTYHYNYDQN